MNTTKRIISMFLCITLVAWSILVSKTTVLSVDVTDLYSLDKDSLVIWYTDETLTDYLNAASVSFNEKYGMRVVPRLQSGDEYLEQVNRASISEEGAPDLFILTNDMLERAYLGGLASEIRDNNEMVSGKFFPQAALEAVSYKDKLVAYPFYFETSALIYNKSYLQEMAQNQVMAQDSREPGENASDEELTEEQIAYNALTNDEKIAYLMEQYIPDTFDELMAFADTCDAPQAVEAIFKWDVKDIFYNYFFVGNYVDVGGPCGDNTEEVNIYNMDAINALTVYQQMNQFFSFDYEDISYQSVIDEFIEGKLIFTTATSDVIKTLQQAKEEELFAFEYGTAAIPDLNQFLQSRSMSVTNTIAVNGYTNKKDSANEFARYLTIEYANNLYELSGKLPADKNVTYGTEAFDAFTYEYSDSVSVPKMMAASNYWLLAEIAFANVWAGKNVSLEMRDLSQQIKLQVTGLDVIEDYIDVPKDDQGDTEYLDEDQLKQQALDEDEE